MDSLFASEYFLLVVGVAILLAVIVGVVLPNTLPTPRGQLNRQRRELRHRLYEYRQADKAAQRARRGYETLRRKAETTDPRKLRAAEERAQDTKTLLGHAHNRVLVAENHVRRTIIDRYPPVQHQKMLGKFAPERDDKPLPFSF